MNQVNSMKKGIVIAAVFSIIWMLTTGVIGTLGLFEYIRHEFHLWIILLVVTPTILYLVLVVIFPSVKDWTQNLNLIILTIPHAWRTVGYTFLALWFYGILPAGFAAPAGFGDFAVAMLAPFVALALWLKWTQSIRFTVAFNILGALDLVIAIWAGTSGFGATADEMVKLDPMTTFPLVIIPTVFVPLLLLLHFMSFTKIWLDKKNANK